MLPQIQRHDCLEACALDGYFAWFWLALCKQVWSLSSFKVSCQLLTNDLNRVSSVSLLMTSSTALANEGLFELTRRPSLTRAVSSSFAETTEEPSCSQVKRPKFRLILVIFKQISPDYNLVPKSFREWQRISPCQRRAPSQLKKPFVGECCRGSHEQVNGRDLIQSI